MTGESHKRCDAEEKFSLGRSKQEASQTINVSKYLDRTAWACPCHFPSTPTRSRNTSLLSLNNHFPSRRNVLLFSPRTKQLLAKVVRAIRLFFKRRTALKRDSPRHEIAGRSSSGEDPVPLTSRFCRKNCNIFSVLSTFKCNSGKTNDKLVTC